MRSSPESWATGVIRDWHEVVKQKITTQLLGHRKRVCKIDTQKATHNTNDCITIANKVSKLFNYRSYSCTFAPKLNCLWLAECCCMGMQTQPHIFMKNQMLEVMTFWLDWKCFPEHPGWNDWFEGILALRSSQANHAVPRSLLLTTSCQSEPVSMWMTQKTASLM